MWHLWNVGGGGKKGGRKGIRGKGKIHSTSTISQPMGWLRGEPADMSQDPEKKGQSPSRGGKELHERAKNATVGTRWRRYPGKGRALYRE